MAQGPWSVSGPAGCGENDGREKDGEDEVAGEGERRCGPAQGRACLKPR